MSTSSNVIGEIGSVASATFSEISPVFYMIAGIVLAFLVGNILIDIANDNRLDREISDTISRSKNLRENV